MALLYFLQIPNMCQDDSFDLPSLERITNNLPFNRVYKVDCTRPSSTHLRRHRLVRIFRLSGRTHTIPCTELSRAM